MEKRSYKIRTIDLLILCNIFDNFDAFNASLLKLIKTDNDLYEKISKLEQGEYFFGAKNIKQFMIDYKDTINIVKKYDSFLLFICFNYSLGHNNSTIHFFYEYLLQNKEHIEEIKSLIEYLLEHGFRDIEFSPLEKFDDIYCIQQNQANNFSFTYLENLEVIPSHIENAIFYKSNGSRYKMVLQCENNHLTNSFGNITLSSLLIKKEELPPITIDGTFNKIVKLQSSIEEVSQKIRNSVLLNACLLDLERDIFNIDKLSSQFSSSYLQERVSKFSKELGDILVSLVKISQEYDRELTQDEITKEFLDKDKDLYLERRRNDINYFR